jgi:hypothetical protein
MQQRDLLTNRWRKVKAPQPSELQIQIALVARLKLLARKDVLWFHVPNGELRDKRTAAKLKAMGALPGVSDLIFICNKKILCLELKASGRKPSIEQLAFAARVSESGGCFEYADSLDDAVAILQKHQILP